jgi:hypothetical protein
MNTVQSPAWVELRFPNAAACVARGERDVLRLLGDKDGKPMELRFAIRINSTEAQADAVLIAWREPGSSRPAWRDICSLREARHYWRTFTKKHGYVQV